MGAFGALGCSWARFDDISSDSPVVALKKPGALEAGFGDGLATIDTDESVQLLSIGVSPVSRGATFELGMSDKPAVDAIDVGHCETADEDVCASITTPVGLARAQGPGEQYDLCFITGIGASGANHGLLSRCADHTQFELPVPDEVDDKIIEPLLDGEVEPNPVRLAADRAPAPAVVAGAPSLALAFYYAPLSREPVMLEPAGEPDESFGTAVAVLKTDTEQRVFAVAAPEAGEVWLFKTVGQRAANIGCLGGFAGFGRTMIGGNVDADEFDDLAIADQTNVTVVSGKVLAELPETTSASCSFASLPEGGLIASFSCGSTKGVSGCPTSDFGHSLAVGDLDGDGDGEVIVGAPLMTVREQAAAGALIVYDAEGDEPHLFSDVLFASSLEANDRLGASLATPNLGDRHIVAAGAPGGSKTFLFYCPGLGGEAEAGSTRCH